MELTLFDEHSERADLPPAVLAVPFLQLPRHHGHINVCLVHILLQILKTKTKHYEWVTGGFYADAGQSTAHITSMCPPVTTKPPPIDFLATLTFLTRGIMNGSYNICLDFLNFVFIFDPDEVEND